MYEYVPAKYSREGLGWSDIEGFPTCQHYPGGGTQRCFVENAADRAKAERFHCIRMERPTDETVCTTTDGTAGRRWCCPSIEMRGDAVPPRLVCERGRVDRATLLTEEERSLWDVQNALCGLGLDPGPVDGRRVAPVALRTAIKSFQYNSMLDDTGELDDVTLRRLGFSGTRLLEMRRQLAPTPGRFAVAGAEVSWLPIVGFLAAGGFLAYVGYRYVTQKGKAF